MHVEKKVCVFTFEDRICAIEDRIYVQRCMYYETVRPFFLIETLKICVESAFIEVITTMALLLYRKFKTRIITDDCRVVIGATKLNSVTLRCAEKSAGLSYRKHRKIIAPCIPITI